MKWHKFNHLGKSRPDIRLYICYFSQVSLFQDLLCSQVLKLCTGASQKCLYLSKKATLSFTQSSYCVDVPQPIILKGHFLSLETLFVQIESSPERTHLPTQHCCGVNWHVNGICSSAPRWRDSVVVNGTDFSVTQLTALVISHEAGVVFKYVPMEDD